VPDLTGLPDDEPQADATATTATTVSETRVREVIILAGSPGRPEWRLNSGACLEATL
jgi:hypothetical protein